MEKTRQVPADALRFDASPMALKESVEGALRQFEGVAYSGEVIRNHFFWGNVIFDLASTRSPGRTPILIEHDRNQRCGVGQLSIGNDAIRIAGVLLDNAHGRAIASESDAGFPWQMSVHIEPGYVEEVREGAAVTVNGQLLEGPLTIFRDSLIRETSFTPTGADPNTSARVFSDAAAVVIPVSNQEGHDMSDASAQRIAELEEQLAIAQNAIQAANDRADAAEAAVAGIRASARLADIKALFSKIGREFSDEAAAPFASMTDEQFAATSDALMAAIPQPPSHLFSEQATQGAAPVAQLLDPTAIYAARQAGNKE